MKRIISKTPVRISFFGGGTDHPVYYRRHPGATLGTTIDKYIYISINELYPFFEHKLRISYSRIELVHAMEEIQHPSVKGCLVHHDIFPPLDIHISSDLPAKTGLGSSSSFTVGFLNALHAMQGRQRTAQQLAEEACYVEQQVIRENVGSQDQFHAAFGGLNIFTFSKEDIQVRPLAISAVKRALFEEHLLLFYTGVTRYGTELLQEQLEKTERCENDEWLQRMFEMVWEAEAIFLSASEREMVPLLGKLMDQSWALKKKLSTKVTTPLIDRFYEKAMECGAYGGKLCGAGSGGFLALLVPHEARSRVQEALHELAAVSVRFETQGSSLIYARGC